MSGLSGLHAHDHIHTQDGTSSSGPAKQEKQVAPVSSLDVPSSCDNMRSLGTSGSGGMHVHDHMLTQDGTASVPAKAKPKATHVSLLDASCDTDPFVAPAAEISPGTQNGPKL